MIIKPYNIHLFFPLRSCILVFKVWFYFQCYRKEKQRIRLSFKLGVYADFDSVLFCHKAINAFMCSAFLLFCIVPFIICFYSYVPGIFRYVSLHFQLTHENFDNHILINISSPSTLVFPIPSLDM